MKNLYYVWRIGANKRLFSKSICYPLEIKKYVECLNSTDKLGFKYEYQLIEENFEMKGATK